VAQRGLDGRLALADRRDDLDVVAQAEEQLERLAEDVVVLDEQDADRVGDARPYSAESSNG
jgi:hypothetical protein